jgi:hypothetical protein
VCTPVAVPHPLLVPARAQNYQNWIFVSVVSGGAAANALVKGLQGEWGKALYTRSIMTSIGQSVYKVRARGGTLPPPGAPGLPGPPPRGPPRGGGGGGRARRALWGLLSALVVGRARLRHGTHTRARAHTCLTRVCRVPSLARRTRMRL